MNLAIIILSLLALFFFLLSAIRFFLIDHQITIAIKTWIRIAVIFSIVCLALVFF